MLLSLENTRSFISQGYAWGCDFKQTQTPFDVSGNWPGVEEGGWLS